MTRRTRSALYAALLVSLGATPLAAEEPARCAGAWDRAMALSDQQRYDEALGEIHGGLECDPANVDLLWLEAGVLGWSGRHRQSVERYEHLIAAHPELGDDVRVALGTQRLWAGRPRGALRDAEARLAEEPGDLEARRLRALALAHAGRHRRSLAAYDELLAERPDDLAARLDRAVVLSWMGRNTQAVEAYREILLEHPDNARARVGLAQNENWRGNHARAAELFEGLADDGHDDPEVLKGLVYANYWADRPEAARTALSRFTAVRPEDEEARHLSSVLRFEDEQTLSAGFDLSDDSDDQRIETATVAYRLPLPRQSALRVLVRDDRVEDPGGTEDPLRVGVGAEKRWGDRWKARAQLLRFDPRNDLGTRGIGSASLAFRPPGRWQYEAGFDVEPVLTRRSLALGIRATTATAAASWRPTDRVTAAGSLQQRDYSDGNSATLLSAGGRWRLPSVGKHRFALLFGVDLLRSEDDLDNGYYDPESYFEGGPGIEWSVELNRRTSFGIQARTGFQKERGGDGDPFYKVSAAMETLLGRALRLGAEVGRSNSSLTADSGFELTRGSIYVARAF